MKKLAIIADATYRNSNCPRQNFFPGYPIYASSEDIYSKFKNVRELNPDDVYKMKESNYIYINNNENELNINALELNLNIPFQEFDIGTEFIGIEVEDILSYYQIERIS